jgi:signal transduction histidine kinase
MWLSVAVAVIVFLTFFMATFVVVRRADRVNLTFALFTYVASIWIVANYLGANFKDHRFSVYFAHLDFMTGLLAVYFYWLFTLALLARPGAKAKLLLFQERYKLWLLGLVVILSVSTLLPVVLRVRWSGVESALSYGSLFIVYSIGLAGLVGLGLLNMVAAYRSSRETQKKQVGIVAIGLGIGVSVVAFANIVVPKLTASSSTNLWVGNVAYLGVVIFVAATFYAVIKHRLFDLQLVVARSVAYAIALAVLSAFYGLIVFSIVRIIFDVRVPIGAQIFLALATGLTGIAFVPFRKYFDRFTNLIFYRDAYEPQSLFDELNKVLVSSLDVKFLMGQSISIIETALKPSQATVLLINESGDIRSFSGRKIAIRDDDMRNLRQLVPKMRQKVVITDHLIDPRQADLRNLLQSNDIAAIVHLTQNLRTSTEGFGYLMFGGKKSGNPYNQQDARVLDTVANELIIAIQNALHYEEIQRFNEALQSRVDEATRKLRRTNDKLKELDETKDDFISMASHQLRTPLTSVKGYLSMVLEGDAGSINDTQKKMLGQAFVSSQRMVYLIADLLNVSRLRTGKFMIEPIRTDLSVMIGEELAQLVETAAARDIQLTYDKPKDYPLLMLDETKTRQVIMNFVDNAIYYTPAGGHIRVELTTTDHAAELRVVDDGIGVPKAEQHHLFTKFYRAGNARKARPDGTGLGLFMAKKVILAQGGIIIFDSHEGKGSTFGFSFPLNKLRATESTQPAQPIIAKIPVAK